MPRFLAGLRRGIGTLCAFLRELEKCGLALVKSSFCCVIFFNGLFWKYSEKMKAYGLLSSPHAWCRDSPARNAQGQGVHALDPSAVRWCALAAIQKVYPSAQWEQKMDCLLRALSVSEEGLARLTTTDKICCLMEWNDDSSFSFSEIREIFLEADL